MTLEGTEAPRLVVRDVVKAYGSKRALNRVSLEVGRGEVMSLLGPNGAGKTTLVSIIAGLRRADSGRVVVNGIDVVAHPREARRQLGLAPQDTGVYPTLTVAENLGYFGRLAGLRGQTLRRHVDEAAQAFALVPHMDRRAGDVSGGEKRRLHNAMAVLHRPPLLLLDEPTAGVDVGTRAALLETVRNLAARGSAVCYSTHYLEEVEALGATVALLDAGELIARGPVAELVARHSRSALELRFEGGVSDVHLERGWEVCGDILRIYSERPAGEIAGVISRLGAAAARLRSVEIVSTSLEGAFLALTGRRYTSEREDEGLVHEGRAEPQRLEERSDPRAPENTTATG